MVDFVLKLNREPGEMTESDVETLREHGFDDREILDIVLLASLYEVMNRLADGLGVQREKS